MNFSTIDRNLNAVERLSSKLERVKAKKRSNLFTDLNIINYIESNTEKEGKEKLEKIADEFNNIVRDRKKIKVYGKEIEFRLPRINLLTQQFIGETQLCKIPEITPSPEQSMIEFQLLESDTKQLELTKEKQEEIKRIERDVKDLAEIFQEIHDLVIIQKEDVDEIEKHVNETKVNVDSGHAELEVASTYNSNYRNKLTIIFGSVLIIALTVVGIKVK
jgi:t-SNARE complex subunit (syntaxin)